MGPVSIGVEVQRNTDGDTPSICSDARFQKSDVSFVTIFLLYVQIKVGSVKEAEWPPDPSVYYMFSLYLVHLLV